ncbi:hypothetical protein AVEN_186213-1 [Araneus ventricosus]|uniref:Uncharacterized protein n=1 Tax=Araneus ventricosus TaxID=182803 RepID=A0A4Y2TDW8_ARAVE|nr:hypothetical protein AVEN_186213-1 [Araneus ventricosus]
MMRKTPHTLTEGRLATTYDLACNRPHTRLIFIGIGFRTWNLPAPKAETLPLGHRRRRKKVGTPWSRRLVLGLEGWESLGLEGWASLLQKVGNVWSRRLGLGPVGCWERLSRRLGSLGLEVWDPMVIEGGTWSRRLGPWIQSGILLSEVGLLSVEGWHSLLQKVGNVWSRRLGSLAPEGDPENVWSGRLGSLFRRLGSLWSRSKDP